MTERGSRPIEIVRIGWGATLLLAPRQMLTDVHQLQVDRRSLAVTRILGARQLSQGLLSGVRPSPGVLAMGVWVDAVHAMTAVGLAATDRSRARAALADTVVAGLWAFAGYHDLRHATSTPASHQRRRDQLARAVLAFVPGGSWLIGRNCSPARGSITS